MALCDSPYKDRVLTEEQKQDCSYCDYCDVDKLKEEISSIMDRAAMGNATVCILNRFANTVQIAAFLISKGKVKEATDWLYGALEWDSEVDIFGDLKDSDGNSEDIQTWFDKQIEGEISFAEAIELIRKHYTELEKLRTA